MKESPAGQMILLQMIMKVSDVAHPARPWDIHLKWSALVTEEFCRQGDREAAANMQISPLCNRNEVVSEKVVFVLQSHCFPLNTLNLISMM